MHDIYTDVTNRIIAELEAGTAPWVRPWSDIADPTPRNALSQRAYRGINTVLLGMEATGRGYSSNQWLTFRQAQQIGGHVRKCERSSTIVYFELKPVEDETQDDPKQRVRPMLKIFHVFNIDQVDGLPDALRTVPALDPAWDSCAVAEQIITDTGAEIRHQGFRAFYSPVNDRIYLPIEGCRRG